MDLKCSHSKIIQIWKSLNLKKFKFEKNKIIQIQELLKFKKIQLGNLFKLESGSNSKTVNI
jgi:hypothetical protein